MVVRPCCREAAALRGARHAKRGGRSHNVRQARMARRAQHLRCSLCERSKRGDNKLDKRRRNSRRASPVKANWCKQQELFNFNCSLGSVRVWGWVYHARMARRAQHLRCYVREANKRTTSWIRDGLGTRYGVRPPGTRAHFARAPG